MAEDTPRGRRWYRHPRQQAAPPPPVDMPDVQFFGPYVELRDTWVGLYWDHKIQGWDGGWWESWSFYLVLIPTIVLRMDVDRSNKPTRAWKRWRDAS